MSRAIWLFLDLVAADQSIYSFMLASALPLIHNARDIDRGRLQEIGDLFVTHDDESPILY